MSRRRGKVAHDSSSDTPADLLKFIIDKVLEVRGITQKLIARSCGINEGQVSQFLRQDGSYLGREKMIAIVSWVDQMMPSIEEELQTHIPIDAFRQLVKRLKKRLNYRALYELHPGNAPIPMTGVACVPRLAEEGQIVDMVGMSSISFIVTGASGVGKTTLMIRAARRITADPHQLLLIRIDARVIREDENLLGILCTRLYETVFTPSLPIDMPIDQAREALLSPDSPLRQSKSYFRDVLPIVMIVIDHIETVDVATRKELYKVIRQWQEFQDIDDFMRVRVCLVGTDLWLDSDIWDLQAPMIRLNPFTVEQVIGLGRVYQVEPDQAREVFQKTKGVPSIVQDELCAIAKRNTGIS